MSALNPDAQNSLPTLGAPHTPGNATEHEAPANNADTTPPTTAYAHNGQSKSQQAKSHAGDAANPSPPPNHGTSATTTTTEPNTEAPNTPTGATEQPPAATPTKRGGGKGPRPTPHRTAGEGRLWCGGFKTFDGPAGLGLDS